MGWHIISGTWVAPSTCAWAHCPSLHASSIPENKHSPHAFPSLLWGKSCQKPHAQGRQACLPGIEDPRGPGQRELFSSKPCTHLLLERLRPARQRAELFVSNPTPKVLANLLPITAKSTGRTPPVFWLPPPDRQECLIPLVEVGGKRYIWGRPGLGPTAPPEELISSQNHRKSYRTLSAPHMSQLGRPGSPWGLSASVAHSHSFLPIFAGTKQIVQQKPNQKSRVAWISI